MDLADLRVHVDAVITVLRDGGLAVGDGEAPRVDVGAGERRAVDPPYAVVDGGSTLLDGPVGARHDDATIFVTVRCAGTTREQADWVRHEARKLLLDDQLGAVAVAGRSVKTDLDVDDTTRRDDDPQPPQWVAVDRYRIWSTPT